MRVRVFHVIVSTVWMIGLPLSTQAQESAWIDELSADGQPIAARSRPGYRLARLEPSGGGFQLLDCPDRRNVMFSRALWSVARGEGLELSAFRAARVVSHTTHTLRCLAGATSANPDADIDIFGYLVVDGTLVDFKTARGYTPSVALIATVPSADYDRRVVCEGLRGFGFRHGQRDSPCRRFTVCRSWGQSWWWNDRWRRDIWYQIYHQDGRTWSRGGDVWEEWHRWYNPCALSIETAIGTVNPSGQFLDTYYSAIRDPACVVDSRISWEEFKLFGRRIRSLGEAAANSKTHSSGGR